MSCTHSKSCPLFAQFALHPALSIWQQRYCEQDFQQCVRYEKSLSGVAIPVTLLPNGKLLAVQQSQEELHGVELFNAVMNNSLPMLLELLEQKHVNPDFRNVEGFTALMVASDQGFKGLVEVLLAHGADPAAKSVVGDTAMDMAARNRHYAIVIALSDAIALRTERNARDADDLKKSA